MTLVTKQSIQNLLSDSRKDFPMHVIGRALVGIYSNQTDQEKSSQSTIQHNDIGFAGCDARIGSICAKYYQKHKRLEKWMIDRWINPGSTGYSRITKYHRQLNIIAMNKQN